MPFVLIFSSISITLMHSTTNFGISVNLSSFSTSSRVAPNTVVPVWFSLLISIGGDASACILPFRFLYRRPWTSSSFFELPLALRVHEAKKTARRNNERWLIGKSCQKQPHIKYLHIEACFYIVLHCTWTDWGTRKTKQIFYFRVNNKVASVHVWHVYYVMFDRLMQQSMRLNWFRCVLNEFSLHLFKKPDSFLFLLSFVAVGDVDGADELADTSDNRSVSSVLSLWIELFVVSTDSIDWALWRLSLFWLLYSADFWWSKYDSDRI